MLRERRLNSAIFGLHLFALAAVCAVGQPATAQTADTDFLKGRPFTVIIGFAPGGGYDAYGRLLAAHIGRFLPGNPNVIVQNMPGASSIQAANYIYAKAPKDGSVIAFFASSAAFAPILGNTAAQFKPDEFTWIGNFDQTTGTCTSWHTSGIKTFQDILKQPAIFGASGPAGLDSEYARGINAVFGTQIRVIHGYNGATSVFLAMERGEVQGGCGFPLSSLNSVRRTDFEAGRIIPLVQFALKSADLPGIPHVSDFARTEDERKLFNLVFNRDILGRPIAAPPGLPPERAKMLRAAFDAVSKEDELRKAAERQFLPVVAQSGADVEGFIRDIVSYPAPIIEKAREALKVGNVENVTLKSTDGTVVNLAKDSIDIRENGGKVMRFELSDRESAIMIGGEKANSGALKVGMACSLRHFGEGDLAKTVACN